MAYYVITPEGEGYMFSPEPGQENKLPEGHIAYEMDPERGLVEMDQRIISDPNIRYGEPGSIGYTLATRGNLNDEGFSNPKSVADFLEKAGAPKDYDWSSAISKAWQKQQSQFGKWSGADDPGQTALKVLEQVDAPWKNEAVKKIRGSGEFEQSQKAGTAAVNYSDDDGFMGTGIPTPIASFAIGMFLGPAGMNIGATLAGGSGVTASAINAGLSSFLTGGDPLKGAVTSLLTGGAGGMLKGMDFGDISAAIEAQDAAMGADMLANSGQSYDDFLASLTSGDGSALDAIAAGAGGSSTDMGRTLLAGGTYGGTADVVPVVDGDLAEQVGGVSKDPIETIIEQGDFQQDVQGPNDLPVETNQSLSGAIDADDAALGQSMLGEQTYEDFLKANQAGAISAGAIDAGNKNLGQPQSGGENTSFGGFNDGLNDSTVPPPIDGGAGAATGGNSYGDILNAIVKNKELATAGVMAGGGLIAGAMNNKAAEDRLEKTVQANSDLQNQKVQSQLELDAGKRAQIQSGSYFDAKVNMRPGSRVLRRPDGSFVYATPGLITGQVRGQP